MDSEDRTAALDAGVRFYRSSLGRYSYVARGSFVESASVGCFCSIGGDCNIGGAGHPLDRVSTSPAFHAGGNIPGRVFCDEPYDPFKRTEIGHDVWIGNGAKVKAGVTVGMARSSGWAACLPRTSAPTRYGRATPPA